MAVLVTGPVPCHQSNENLGAVDRVGAESLGDLAPVAGLDGIDERLVDLIGPFGVVSRHLVVGEGDGDVRFDQRPETGQEDVLGCGPPIDVGYCASYTSQAALASASKRPTT